MIDADSNPNSATCSGDKGVSVELAAREKASVDGSRLSPVISEQLPLGLADLVAYPATAEEIAAVVGAAVRHGVPITPRGKGTGNYGQAIPMSGGLVLDMSRARAIIEVGDGFLTAEAGATMVAVELAANKAGQQVLMYPSTAQSSLGGFVSGGSGGTGSIKHGMLHEGFVLALDVVHAVPDAQLVHVEGEAAAPYIHNYGTAGIIARAHRAHSNRCRTGAGSSRASTRSSRRSAVIRPFADLEPTPRLVSADLPTLAEALPDDPAIPAGSGVAAGHPGRGIPRRGDAARRGGRRPRRRRSRGRTDLDEDLDDELQPPDRVAAEGLPEHVLPRRGRRRRARRPHRRGARGLPRRHAAHRGAEGPTDRHARRHLHDRRRGLRGLREARRRSASATTTRTSGSWTTSPSAPPSSPRRHRPGQPAQPRQAPGEAADRRPGARYESNSRTSRVRRSRRDADRRLDRRAADRLDRAPRPAPAAVDRPDHGRRDVEAASSMPRSVRPRRLAAAPARLHQVRRAPLGARHDVARAGTPSCARSSSIGDSVANTPAKHPRVLSTATAATSRCCRSRCARSDG